MLELSELSRTNTKSNPMRIAVVLLVVLIVAGGLIYGLRLYNPNASTGLFATIEITNTAGQTQTIDGAKIPAFSAVQISGINGGTAETLYDSSTPTSVGYVTVIPTAAVAIKSGTAQSWSVSGSCQMNLGTLVLTNVPLNQQGTGAPPAQIQFSSLQEQGNDLWQKMGGTALSSTTTAQTVSVYCTGTMTVIFTSGPQTQSFSGTILSASVSGTNTDAFSVNVTSQPITNPSGSYTSSTTTTQAPTYYTVSLSTSCGPSTSSLTGGCGGTVSGGGAFIAGTAVSVTATPASGYTFAYWAQCINGAQCPSGSLSASNSYAFTVAQNTNLVAVFTQNAVTTTTTTTTPSNDIALTTSVSCPSGSNCGVIAQNPTGSSFNHNSGVGVAFSANPNSGYSFNHWTYQVNGGAVYTVNTNPMTLTLSISGSWVVVGYFTTTATTTTTTSSGGISPSITLGGPSQVAQNSYVTMTATVNNLPSGVSPTKVQLYLGSPPGLYFADMSLSSCGSGSCSYTFGQNTNYTPNGYYTYYAVATVNGQFYNSNVYTYCVGTCTPTTTTTTIPTTTTTTYIGGGGSVIGSTMVTLPDGSQMPIDQLRVGQSVLGYDPITGQMAPSMIAQILVKPAAEFYTINTACGSVTSDAVQPFFTGRYTDATSINPGFTYASQLRIGEPIMTMCGSLPISSITTHPGFGYVYDLKLSGYKAYFGQNTVVDDAIVKFSLFSFYG